MSEQRPTTVVHTNPGWRVLAVGLAAGASVALGFYFSTVGHAEDVATIMVITAVYSVSYWARRRPDRLRARTGPFARIATAVVESQDELREWTLARPLRVGVLLAAVYGVGVVVAKSLIVAVLDGWWSWQLGVAVGCAVAAATAAPELLSGLARRVAGAPTGTPRPAPGSDPPPDTTDER